jgi:WD40 repeat protein
MPIKILKGHPTYVVQVAWSPDGNTIVAAGGESGILSKWDVGTGNYQARYEFGQAVRGLAWQPNGKTVAAVCPKLAVQIWDPNTYKVQTTFGEITTDFHSVAWSPDGKLLAAGTIDKVILFDGETGKAGKSLEGHGFALAWSKDGKQLAVSNPSASTLKVWDPIEATEIKSGSATAYTLHFAPDGKQVMGANYSMFSVWEVESGKVAHSFEIAGTVPPFWWSNKPILTGIGTAKLSLWDHATGKFLRALEGHESSVSAVSWSPDGKTLASASHDKTVRLWDTATGKSTLTFSGHSAPVLAVAFSPDGKLVASGGQDKTVFVWDPASGKQLQSLDGHQDAVTTLAWQPGLSGNLASGGNDKQVKLWNAKTGQAGKTLSDNGATELYSLAWSTDGKTLVSGHYDHRARMWQVATGKLLFELESPGSPPQVSALAWSPIDTLLASGRGNHTLQLWNVKTGTIAQSYATMAPVQRVAWTPGGSTVACSSADRTCRFFDTAAGLRGMLLAEEGQIVGVSFDGHYRAETAGAAELIVVAQMEKSQETLTPAQFATKFKWKNNPSAVKLTGK